MHPLFQKLASESRHRTLVMGILNITPDSFSDGGRFLAPEAAFRQARDMVEQGADLLDLGGESTRPGAPPVDEEEEARRVLPVARMIRESWPGLPWSIDTQKAGVARAALELGACMVNDVSALGSDLSMARLAADSGCGLVLMHRREASAAMRRSDQETRDYGAEGVVESVRGFLRERAAYAAERGIPAERIWIDPGFGFGKTVADNLSLLKHLDGLTSLGFGVLVGTSRKSTIGTVLGGLPVAERLEGTAATVALSVWMGAACVRVHDVRAMARVVKMTQAVRDAA